MNPITGLTERWSGFDGWDLQGGDTSTSGIGTRTLVTVAIEYSQGAADQDGRWRILDGIA